MTKKDYELLADSIKQALGALLYAPVNANEVLRSIEVYTNILCTKLEADNPRFDRTKFLKACNLN